MAVEDTEPSREQLRLLLHRHLASLPPDRAADLRARLGIGTGSPPVLRASRELALRELVAVLGIRAWRSGA